MAPFLLPLTHFSIELFLDLKLCVLGNKWKVDISQKLWAIKKEVIHFFSHQQLFAFAKHSQSRSFVLLLSRNTTYISVANLPLIYFNTWINFF